MNQTRSSNPVTASSGHVARLARAVLSVAALAAPALTVAQTLPPPPPPFGNFPDAVLADFLVELSKTGIGVSVPIHALAISGLNLDSSSMSSRSLAERPKQLSRLPGGGVVAALPLGGGASGDDARWRLLFSGNSSRVDRDTNLAQKEVGYRSKDKSISLGADFRVNPTLTVGLVYTRLEGDVTFDPSEKFIPARFLVPSFSTALVDLTADTVAAFANFRRDRFYAELFVSHRRTDIDMRRNVYQLFEVQTIRGENSSTTDTVSGSAGRDYGVAGGTISPFVRLDYYQQRTGAYTERGETGLENRYEGQTTKVTQGVLGMNFSRPFSTSFGVVTPSLSAEWVHVLSSDKPATVFAPVVNLENRRVYGVGGVDRNFANAIAGVSVQLPRGFAAYASYQRVFDLRDTRGYAVNAGVSFEF